MEISSLLESEGVEELEFMCFLLLQIAQPNAMNVAVIESAGQTRLTKSAKQVLHTLSPSSLLGRIVLKNAKEFESKNGITNELACLFFCSVSYLLRCAKENMRTFRGWWRFLKTFEFLDTLQDFIVHSPIGKKLASKEEEEEDKLKDKQYIDHILRSSLDGCFQQKDIQTFQKLVHIAKNGNLLAKTRVYSMVGGALSDSRVVDGFSKIECAAPHHGLPKEFHHNETFCFFSGSLDPISASKTRNEFHIKIDLGEDPTKFMRDVDLIIQKSVDRLKSLGVSVIFSLVPVSSRVLLHGLRVHVYFYHILDQDEVHRICDISSMHVVQSLEDVMWAFENGMKWKSHANSIHIESSSHGIPVHHICLELKKEDIQVHSPSILLHSPHPMIGDEYAKELRAALKVLESFAINQGDLCYGQCATEMFVWKSRRKFIKAINKSFDSDTQMRSVCLQDGNFEPKLLESADMFFESLMEPVRRKCADSHCFLKVANMIESRDDVFRFTDVSFPFDQTNTFLFGPFALVRMQHGEGLLGPVSQRVLLYEMIICTIQQIISTEVVHYEKEEKMA